MTAFFHARRRSKSGAGRAARAQRRSARPWAANFTWSIGNSDKSRHGRRAGSGLPATKGVRRDGRHAMAVPCDPAYPASFFSSSRAVRHGLS